MPRLTYTGEEKSPGFKKCFTCRKRIWNSTMESIYCTGGRCYYVPDEQEENDPVYNEMINQLARRAAEKTLVRSRKYLI